MPDGFTRSDLLRGLRSRKRSGPRPPWARHEARFVDLCQRCDACLPACPEGILTRGSGGFPEVDFTRGECTFCGACQEVCKYQAFDLNQEKPWSAVAQIAPSCISAQGVLCRLCEEQCEARAIRFRPALGGRALPDIDQSLCTGCGACVAPCPVSAITVLEAVT